VQDYLRINIPSKVFEQNPWVLEYPVIFTDTEHDRAERDGHTLWSQLRPVIEENPNTHFMLTHFSFRHSD
jgi:ribonuclease Z